MERDTNVEREKGPQRLENQTVMGVEKDSNIMGGRITITRVVAMITITRTGAGEVRITIYVEEI